MRIAYIYPPFYHKPFEEDIDIVSREFGLFPPLGLAYAAAITERAGHASMIIDANALSLTKEKVLEQVRQWKPDMLGFLLTAYAFFDTLAWIRFLKKETGVPIVVGNALCAMYPEIVMKYPEIDYVVVGPATDVLPQLIQRVENKETPEGIKGLGWHRNGSIVFMPLDTMKEDFDRLPFPARHLLPNEKYHAVMSKRKNYTIMITSKGCNAACTFCHIHEIPYSERRPESVVAEMEECSFRYGIKEMDIFDPSFTLSRERVKKICRGIIEKNIDMHWACRARVDQVDEGLLSLMSRAGCKRILYGIESGSNEMLKKMGKGICIDQTQKAIAMTKAVGIKALGFFMLGVPGETEQTLYETVRFSRTLNLDYAQYHRTIAKPKTQLSLQLKEALGYDYWHEYLNENMPEKRLPAPWTRCSDVMIQKAAKQAYLAFYFRPKYLIRLITGIKSWNELMRYVRSAIGLLLSKKDQ